MRIVRMILKFFVEIVILFLILEIFRFRSRRFCKNIMLQWFFIVNETYKTYAAMRFSLLQVLSQLKHSTLMQYALKLIIVHSWTPFRKSNQNGVQDVFFNQLIHVTKR